MSANAQHRQRLTLANALHSAVAELVDEADEAAREVHVGNEREAVALYRALAAKLRSLAGSAAALEEQLEQATLDRGEEP